MRGCGAVYGCLNRTFNRDNSFTADNQAFKAPSKKAVLFYYESGVITNQQAFCSESKKIEVVFQGQLNNQWSLSEQLNLGNPIEPNNAKLIGLGYERYGVDFFSKLLGSFAFILYNHVTKTLILVNDQQGDYRLFYHQANDEFVVATDLQSLLSIGQISPQLDQVSMASYFAETTALTSHTYFQKIHQLLPGHYIEASGNQLNEKCYWTFPLAINYKYSNEKQAADKFRETLKKSVFSAIENHNKIAVLLSGGMDSTSALALALEAKKAGTDFLAISHVFDKYKECDERIYLDTLYQRFGIRSLQINADDCLPLSEDPFDLHRTINHIWMSPMAQQRRKSYPIIMAEGCDSVLTGEFSDQMFISNSYWLKDLNLQHRSIAMLINTIREQCSKSPLPWYKDPVIRRLLPFNGITAGRFAKFSSYLTPFSFEQVNKMRKEQPFNFIQREQDRYQACLSQRSSDEVALLRQEAEYYDFEPLLPFRDRRLLEFTLNLPAHYLYDYKSELRKSILRQSMKGILPELVRARKKPTHYRTIIRDSLTNVHKNVVKEILFDSSCSWNNYIDQSYLQSRIDRENVSDGDLHLIWHCICFELWMKKFKRFHG